jgi:hypothetical protein
MARGAMSAREEGGRSAWGGVVAKEEVAREVQGGRQERRGVVMAMGDVYVVYVEAVQAREDGDRGARRNRNRGPRAGCARCFPADEHIQQGAHLCGSGFEAAGPGESGFEA